MSRNNYKKNTYALIKRGEIYEITKEGNVKKQRIEIMFHSIPNIKFRRYFIKCQKRKHQNFYL